MAATKHWGARTAAEAEREKRVRYVQMGYIRKSEWYVTPPISAEAVKMFMKDRGLWYYARDVDRVLRFLQDAPAATRVRFEPRMKKMTTVDINRDGTPGRVYVSWRPIEWTPVELIRAHVPQAVFDSYKERP